MRVKDNNKINKIFESTLELNKSFGFSGLTMSKIAKHAGIATGTLYIYFKDKVELINSLYIKLKKQKASELLSVIKSDAPFKLNFKFLTQEFINKSLNNQNEVAFLEQYYRSPYLNTETIEYTTKLFKPIDELINKGKKDLIIKNYSKEMLFCCISGIIKEYCTHVNNNIIVHNDKNFNQLFKLIWDGIKE